MPFGSADRPRAYAKPQHRVNRENRSAVCDFLFSRNALQQADFWHLALKQPETWPFSRKATKSPRIAQLLRPSGGGRGFARLEPFKRLVRAKQLIFSGKDSYDFFSPAKQAVSLQRPSPTSSVYGTIKLLATGIVLGHIRFALGRVGGCGPCGSVKTRWPREPLRKRALTRRGTQRR